MQKAEKKYLPKGAGKNLISNPVMRQSRNLQLTSKIPTVDLATAKKKDQEKRLMQDSAATTTAQPAALSQQAIFQQPQTFKRKEVGSPSLAAGPEMVAFRQGAAAAMTSSTQLSPGVRDLRLRSPRQNVDQLPSQLSATKVLSPPSDASSQPMRHIASMLAPTVAPEELFQRSQQSVSNTGTNPRTRTRSGTATMSTSRSNITTGRVFTDPNKPPSIPPALQQVPNMPASDRNAQSPIPLVPRVEPLPPPQPSLVPRSMSVRNDIRPSRHIKSPTPPVELPPKTAAQMRPMTGIPGNPKARRMLSNLGENQKSHDYAMMFANAAVLAALPEISATNPVSLSRDSVIHRPRPIPRKESLYHADFVSKVSPMFKHRRSLSVGSIDVYRASLKSQASELSSIPSFPSPPKSAGPIMSRPTTPGAFELGLVSPPDSQVVMSTQQRKRPVTTGPVSKRIDAISTETASRQASVRSQTSMNSTKRRSSPVIPAGALRSLSMLGDSHTHNRGMSEPPTIFPPVKRVEASNSSPEGTPPTPPAKDTPSSVDKPAIRPDQSQSQPWQSRTKIGTPASEPRSWHRRVGEPCPTFSDRKDGSFTQRKFAAPRPLMLQNRMMRPVYVQAEPSPIESPQQALEMIQKQLDKLDSPDVEPAPKSAREQQRRTLLQNLENEMDMQENQWQKMRESLARQSAGVRSSVDTSSQPASSVQSPQATSVEKGNPRDNDNTPQDNQVERVPSSSQMTLLSVTNSLSQMSSPTPPDSDESGSDFDDDLEFEMIQPKKSDVIASVVQKLYGPPNPAGSHWSLDSDATAALSQSAISSRQPSASLTPPKEDITPVPNMRLISQRFSTPLSNPKEPPAVVRLPARPKTLKPPRRSKRITQLPDIPESPRVIDNKRGTMGYFKLATGETSDTASMPPDGLMPVLAQLNDIPLAHPVQVPQLPILASQAQPGSFFDHYGEDEGDNFQASDDELDDDFDEMTLWEIANLLKSDEIPSRDSLFPRQSDPEQPNSPVPKDFDGPSGLQEESVQQVLKTKPLVVNHQPPSLWVGKSPYAQVPKYIGLSQPSHKMWKTYLDMPWSVVRSQTRRSRVQSAALSSSTLWSPGSASPKTSKNGLWDSEVKPVTGLVCDPSSILTSKDKPVLWTERLAESEPAMKTGIASPDESKWRKYVDTSIGPSKSVRVPRKSQIMPVSSDTLWASEPKQEISTVKTTLWSKIAASFQPKIESKSEPAAKPEQLANMESEEAQVQLWSAPTQEPILSKGLHQSEDSWKRYTLAGETGPAPSKLRQSTTPASVTSRALWSASQTSQNTQDESKLWTGGRVNVNVEVNKGQEDGVAEAEKQAAKESTEPTQAKSSLWFPW